MLIRRIFNSPALYRNPFNELERIRRRMDMLTGNLFTGSPQQAGACGVYPALNVTEDKDKYYIRAELPGLKTEELDIQATGRSISISGQKKIAPEDDNAKYHRREREAGRFSRIIDLPDNIDTEKVEAGLASGILTITIPKAEAVKPKQITIR
ncbi:MAG: Hsp20/alpha crystallin family protein [Desulfosalsimonadaceae bacterium]|nr:Hsp20/alpha crystallin family protein [Desulfosalsimonadaceae bacterium]